MFTHLRLHTEFSILDGVMHVNAALDAAKAAGQPALAVTDLNAMFGAIKFYKAALAKGIKPLLGCELALAADGALPPSRILLLAASQQGYLNLSELLTRACIQGADKGQALATWAWLQEFSGGLIALSGAQAGPLGAALLQGRDAEAADTAQRLEAMFPQRFYVEVQRAGRVDDEAHIAAAVPLAAQLGLPVVATHPIQFLRREDYEAHEARVCIAGGEILGNPRRVRQFTEEQYFKSSEEMQALFADIPSALENAVEIARRCNVTLTLGKPQLPNFPVPEGQSVEQFFRQQAADGLQKRLLQLFPDENEREARRAEYEQRLAFELDIIVKMGFPGYFLIVADFINWAKHNGCPVGPGRGSGAGSLVAYALAITDLDPLHYKLLFERFLNPERVSMPDFDVDFCQSNRDRVIDYVKERYGKDAVSQIATFGTMAARAAIRDVGRVMDMSYGFCDSVCRLIPNKPGKPVTLKYPPADVSGDDREKYAILAEPQLAERLKNEEEVKTLVEMAQKLEGVTRNIGMHAGGVIIAPGKLTDFCPLYQQPGSDAAVSQYDKDDVEAAGLVKFDFLGLATLTILELAKEFIIQRHSEQKDFAFEHIPLDDKAVFKLFQRGRTEAVFQFESPGMQRMLREALPTRLEDLIALNALYRPGPMDLIPSFIARKHGREPVVYPHPSLEGILSETYGIMVYQEQVMQTAQILAGYSLGAADLLRRAMGKKKASEMARHREIFRKGAAEKNISEHKADEVFDLMEKFAGYGFNKSHAAAYSLLAYHTAWVKVHYAAEFFCANMTVEMGNTDKLRVLLDDARASGLQFESPDINRGVWRFEPVSDTLIRYGLGAIKGTGQQAIEAIVAAREGTDGGEAGPFTSFFNFCRRVDRGRVNKRCVDALIRAGAFDALEANRAALLAAIDVAFEYAAAVQANAQQGGLFDALEGSAGASDEEPPLPAMPPLTLRERLAGEKLALGFHLSGHMFDESADEVRRIAPLALADVQESREPQVLAGIVSDLRIINGPRGRVALFVLDDKSARLPVRMEGEALALAREWLREDAPVVVRARVLPDRFTSDMQLAVQQLWSLAAARCIFGAHLRVAAGGMTPDALRTLLAAHPPRVEHSDKGNVPLALPVRLAIECRNTELEAAAEYALGEKAHFFPSEEALAAWRQLASGGRAEVIYPLDLARQSYQ
ncbi:MAG: DNA polymerase III subunit alpha [Ottowia sp.]|nr:DNA polymerase III subunit alpha [Ottowia sp.]